jgi:Cyclic nucleotide-binding domain
LEAMGIPMLLHDGLEVAWTHHHERLFLLLRMLYDPALIQRVRDNIELGSREKRAYALEVLDNVLDDEFKPLVLPLLEDLGTARRLELWNKSFRLLGVSNLLTLESLLDIPADYDMESRTPWIKCCVIQALVRDPRYKSKIEVLRDESVLVQNTLEWARKDLSSEKEKRTMLSIIERVMILKTVSIFRDTPDYLLAEVADLLEEQHLAAGETFITKDDPAICMYIIVNGEVSVHDGEHEVNQLGPRDIVGEMAVLDAAPRTASVTTISSTHLLKLDRTPFFELIADRAEVAQGIIRVLVGRLRHVLSTVGK